MNPDDFALAYAAGGDDQYGSGASAWANLNNTIAGLGNLAGNLLRQGQQLQQAGANLPASLGIVQTGGNGTLGTNKTIFGLTPVQFGAAVVVFGVLAIFGIRALRK